MRALVRPLGRLLPLALCLALAACGARFPGALPPEPVWSSLSDEAINPQDREAVYAKGSTSGAKRIDQRRAVAEAAAISALKATVLTRTMQLMGTGNGGARPLPPPGEVKEVELMLSRLPWHLAARVEERYFDAERDTQHALARVTFEGLKQVIMLDASDGAVKAAAIEYTGYAFKSLRP